MCKVYYYMRISTTEERGLQKFSRQEKALARYAEENGLLYDEHYIYRDDKSGASFINRTQWNLLEEDVQAGDTIIFKDICRFTREVKNGLEKYMYLMNEKKVNLIFLDNPTLSTSYIQALSNARTEDDNILSLTMDFIVKLILTVELDRSEKERLITSQRIKDGIQASSKKSGRPEGKLDKITDTLKSDIYAYLNDRSIKQIDLINKHGICRNTLKKYISLAQKNKL